MGIRVIFMSVDKQVRYLIKPLLFAAALVPFGVLVVRTLGWEGASLGANPIEEVLHACGKWALIFLLVTLSITPLRRMTGLNALVRLRRMLGLFAFFYATLHVATYLILDQGMDFEVVFEDVIRRPYITIGFLAFVLLWPLAITSTKRMMRRLGSRWQKLHRLTYVAAILGVWHNYWQVKADIRTPVTYALVLLLLLGYRAYRRLPPAPASTLSPQRESRESETASGEHTKVSIGDRATET
jgi:sulfoxide reductase heme-binding subunit YedZ